MPRGKKKDTDGSRIEALCPHCGHALYDFLHQMEEHNAEVVCPACGKKHAGKQPGTVPPQKD